MNFIRNISHRIVQKLKTSPLFLNNLREDIRSGEVFMAIRMNRIDFYYRGGKLFSFGIDGFATHVKHAAVLSPRADSMMKDKNYIMEKDLETMRSIRSFEEGYERIKENCALFSEKEAEGVAEVYRKFSYAKTGDIVVLDIEIAFSREAEDEGGPFKLKPRTKSKMDRIDLLLLNKINGELRFCEAKHFSNPEIWSKNCPRVVEQIRRYEKQIRERNEEIKEQYRIFLRRVEAILEQGICKNDIQTLNSQCGLYVFGFDKNQRDGRLKELVQKQIQDQGIRKYFKGSVPRTLSGMWKGN